MSGQPAARLTDMITCPVPQTTPAALPHAPPPGLPIMPPCAITVLIGGQPAARVGDMSMCVAPAPLPNPILRGAFPVPVAMMPAARLMDQGTHPGSMITGPCCPTVLIGLSGTAGNVLAGTTICQNMAAGRAPAAGATDSSGNPLTANTAGQSYNNCGIETSRQMINLTGGNQTQEGLMNQAIAGGNATQPAIGSVQAGGGGAVTPGSPGTTVTAANQAFFSGGTTSQQQAAILNANGVPATRQAPNAGGAQLSQFELPASQGRGIQANGDVSGLPGWGTQTGAHSVLVTGLEYDDAGNITHVHYNDTGIGACGQRATAAQFQSFLSIGAANATANGFAPSGFVTTNNQIW